MAADEARAERIRELKLEHPEFTWQAIADEVGVTVRAAQSWQEKGAISYTNAKKLAELLDEDVDFIMRGKRPNTPTLDQINGSGQPIWARRLEAKLDGLLDHFGVTLPIDHAEAFERELEEADAQGSTHAEDTARTARDPQRAAR